MSKYLVDNISSLVEEQVGNFIKKVSAEFELPEQKLREIWNGGGQVKSEKPNEPTKSPACVHVPPTSLAKSKKTCKYVMMRGSRKGTICGCEIKDEGSDYCKLHNKKSNTGKKERKTTSIPDPIDMQTSKVLRRNKSTGRLWHESSGMIFNDTKQVTHRIVEGEMKELTIKDIEECRKLNFAYIELKPQEEVIQKELSPDTINEVEELLKTLQIQEEKVGMDIDDSDEELLEEEE